MIDDSSESEFSASFPRLRLGFPDPTPSTEEVGFMRLWCRVDGGAPSLMTLRLFRPAPYMYGTHTCEYIVQVGEETWRDHALGSQSFASMLEAIRDISRRLERLEQTRALEMYYTRRDLNNPAARVSASALMNRSFTEM